MESQDVIVRILAKTDDLDMKLKQSASSFGGAMRKIESEADRASSTVSRSAKEIRNNTRILGQQWADVGAQLSGGSSPFTVIAQQGPQIASAMSTMKGAVGGVATFLSGPWGAAGLAATTVLASFLLKTKETSDSVEDLIEKLRRKAAQDEMSSKAQEAFNKTAEGAAISLRKFTDEIEKQNRTLEENIRLMQSKARGDIATLRTGIAGKEGELAEAKTRLRAAEEELRRAESGEGAVSPSDAAARITSALSNLDAARRAVAELNKKIREWRASLAGGQRALEMSEFPLIEKAAKDALDPLAQINNRYDAMVKAAEKASLGNKKLAASLQDTVNGIEAQRKAALDAERDRQRQSKAGGTSNFIMPVEGRISSGFGARSAPTKGASTFHNGIDIAAPLGTPVKAAQGGVVIHAGKLGGLGNVVIVDHGGGTITEYGHLSSILAQRGQQVGQGAIIGKVGSTGISTGPHLDYRVKVGGKYVDPRKGTFATNETDAALKAERAASEEAARQERQRSILGSLQERYAAALAKLAEGTEESADAQKAAIEAQRVELDRKLDADKKLDPEIRAQAKALNDATAALTKEIVDRADAERRYKLEQEDRQRNLTVAEALNQQQQDALQLQSSLAKTQSERRDIELRILKLAIEEERLRAQAVIAERDRLAAELGAKILRGERPTDEEVTRLANANAAGEIAQGTLNALPSREAGQTQQILDQTAGPLQQLLKSVPQSAQEMSEAFEAIAAHGLDSLSSAITDVIAGTASLKEAFGNLAQSIIKDILQMTIRMLIFRAISGLFGKSGGDPGVNIGDSFLSETFGAATGGFIRGPGTGTSDSIPARLSNGEYVMQASAVKKLGVPFLNALNRGKTLHFADGGLVSSYTPSNLAARSPSQGTVVQQFFTLDARHGITTPELLRHVNTVAAQKAGDAGKAAFDASQKAMPARITKLQKLGS